ncbi:MAG: hypothetical protein M3R35_04750 [Candidatus Eremiobacteraeota bacterium]|nr:hypothetical protein [Candidatus Eremiobacteraeota bacterium]
MTNDFVEQAKRKVREIGKQLSDEVDKRRETLSPQMNDALHATQAQAEDAMTEVQTFLKKTAQSIRDDINKRP